MMDAKYYQESNYLILNVMTYSLTDRLEAESFHDYKYNMDMRFRRELGEGNLF
jgi:hypothetical protein